MIRIVISHLIGGISLDNYNPKIRCEGWDSNPRTPARSGPEPDAVDLAWLPSRLYRLYMRLHKDRG
jgi:hypothetical protein